LFAQIPYFTELQLSAPFERHMVMPHKHFLDKNAAYPEAFTTAQDEKIIPRDCKLRRVKYLNNIIEQDHRFVKKKVRAAQCFKSFHTAERTLEGIEAVNMMRKGQVKRLDRNDVLGQAKFVETLFQIAA
jgi:IS6 family transposase